MELYLPLGATSQPERGHGRRLPGTLLRLACGRLASSIVKHVLLAVFSAPLQAVRLLAQARDKPRDMRRVRPRAPPVLVIAATKKTRARPDGALLFWRCTSEANANAPSSCADTHNARPAFRPRRDSTDRPPRRRPLFVPPPSPAVDGKKCARNLLRVTGPT